MTSVTPLNPIQEPGRVSSILLFLRIAMTSLLVLFCLLIEKMDQWSIGLTIDWPLLIALSILQLVFSILQSFITRSLPTGKGLGGLLLMDIMVWFGLVAASGGVMNPAISYILILLAISAISLSLKLSSFLTIMSSVIYVLLMEGNDHSHHGMSEITWHLWGMWLLFTLNAFILLGVISYLVNIIRLKDQAIALQREENVRNEQLIAMGTLAANLAHELGTPLSTMNILLEENEDETAKLIREQIGRCKTTLSELKQIHQEGKEQHSEDTQDFLEGIKQDLLLLRPEKPLKILDDAKCRILVSPLLKQSVMALLNNAATASNTSLVMHLSRKHDKLLLDIEHDGKKLDQSQLERIGTSFIESRTEGLGIGIYLANASIEQLGGKLEMYNLDQGVLTRIVLPQV